MTIQEKIIHTIANFSPSAARANVYSPENELLGHYSTNIAFVLAKEKHLPPIKVAEELALYLKKSAPDIFERVDVARPGFVNMWIKRGVFFRELRLILKEKSHYGKRKLPRSRRKKIQVEFISANPTGPLTLANGRGGFLGDALGNVLRAVGFSVEKEYYVNDTGNQVLTFGKSLLAARGIISDEETFYKGEYIKKWAEKNAKLVGRYAKKPLELGKRASKDFLRMIQKTVEKKARIRFDRYTSEEADIHKKGYVKKALDEFQKKNRVYKSDGATWLKTTDYGDDKDRVLIKKDNDPTYFLADAGHYLETKKRGFNAKILILGPDHYGYVARIQAVARILGIEKSDVIITQAVRLMRDGKEIKMSKRKGEFVTFEELVEEVGSDAARFFFLMISAETHMNFDLKLAKERSLKNPVFYAQYAAVRARSILKKTGRATLPTISELNKLSTDDDTRLIKKLSEFPDILMNVSEDYKAHRLTQYTLELARAFHGLYEKERILGEEKSIAKMRTALISASFIVFKNLFTILGISLPTKM